MVDNKDQYSIKRILKFCGKVDFIVTTIVVKRCLKLNLTAF